MENKTDIKKLPAERCVICSRTLEEVGGLRIVAQDYRGYAFSDKPERGGQKDIPRQSFKVSEVDKRFIVFWGKMWNCESITRAIDELKSGKRPWFCQICGVRACTECGAPIRLAMGSEILHDNGSIGHMAIFPCHGGCCNPNCKYYRPPFNSSLDAPPKIKQGDKT